MWCIQKVTVKYLANQAAICRYPTGEWPFNFVWIRVLLYSTPCEPKHQQTSVTLIMKVTLKFVRTNLTKYEKQKI